MASLTPAWKASESFSAAKNGSTSTPKHNSSGDHRGFEVIEISGLCPEASGQRQSLSEGLVPDTNKKETVCFQKPRKSLRIIKSMEKCLLRPVNHVLEACASNLAAGACNALRSSSSAARSLPETETTCFPRKLLFKLCETSKTSHCQRLGA